MRLLKQATDRQGSVVCFCVATAVVTRGWLGRRAWVLLYMRAELLLWSDGDTYVLGWVVGMAA